MEYKFASGKLIVIPTTIFGAKGKTVVNLAVDTGATECLMGQQVLDFLGYDLDKGEKQKVTTASKREILRKIRVDKIEALGIE